MCRLTELRWRLSDLFFRISYRTCPDKGAYDYVMRYGIEQTRRALQDIPEKEGE